MHVGLHHLQGVLLDEGCHQANALEVGGHLGLHVAQIIIQGSGAADPGDLLLEVCRGHKQLCNPLLL